MKGKKTGGRQKGTPNKATALTRDIINDLANQLLPTIAEDYAMLEPKDRINVFLKLVEFIVPKPQRLDIDLKTDTTITIEDTLALLAQENEH